MVSWLGNQFQASSTVTRKVSQHHHRALTSAQDCYLDDAVNRQQLLSLLETLLLCLEEEFPEKHSIATLQRLSLHLASILCVPLIASNRKDRIFV
ncbi:hypothetical protein TNCV_2217021 [Trichonephila clavipes]|nr:hypothetical protein TNCV_2217021 [Trichonephila clavipes]